LDFQIEGACMVGDWDEVKALLDDTNLEAPQVSIARVLVAMQSSDEGATSSALSNARMILGRPISAAGAREYRRTYEAVLSLHVLHDFEMIRDVISAHIGGPNSNVVLANLARSLDSRLDATQPSHKIREPILSMRRIAFGLRCVVRSPVFLKKTNR